MKKDLVLGAVNGYSWNQVECWAFSLISSGFKGIGAVIVYDNNQEVISNLKNLGFQVIEMKIKDNVFNGRFLDFYDVTKSTIGDFRYLICTDVRDVFFQSDPTVWLEKNLTNKAYAVSEGLAFKNEEWNRQNLFSGFNTFGNRILDKTIYNVGVLAGEAKAVSDLCFNVYMTAKSTGYQVADQSGYNMLLDMPAYEAVTQYGKSEDGFACQAGTFADPSKIDQFRPNLSEPEPKFENGVVKTNAGVPYAIVHQYDRVPEWDKEMRKVLNNKLTELNKNKK